MKVNKSIWVIDDDPIFRLIFSMTVKKLFDQFTIVEHENGQVACDTLDFELANDGDIPLCLFIDINMPEMSGWDCLERVQNLVKGKSEGIPKIFIVSSSINPVDKKRAFKFSVTTDFLTKPISIEKFKEILLN